MDGKRFWPVMALALAAGLLGGALSGWFFSGGKPGEPGREQVSRKVIVANEFHLVDGEGKDRWVLALSRAGEPNFTFVNSRGWAPMAMGVNKEGVPFLNMILEPGKTGGPSLVLMDSAMRNRLLLGLGGEGAPFLSLLDEKGRARAVLGGGETLNPLTGSVEKRPLSSLVLIGADQEILWAVPPYSAVRQAGDEREVPPLPGG